MPTYNGKNIVTGILYEDGTIEVKDGFSNKEDQSSSGVLSVGSLNYTKRRDCILQKDSYSETQGGALTVASLDMAKRRQAIVTPSNSPDDIFGAVGVALVSVKRKLSIVIP